MGLVRRFLFNDASWRGQCASAADFQQCIRFCLEVNSALKKFGGGLEVGYNFTRGHVGYVDSVQEALNHLDREQRIRVRLWLDKDGPWWDRPPRHSSDEYFECQDDVVTDTALAEAAQLSLDGGELCIVSLPKGPYVSNTLKVTWHEGPFGTTTIPIVNVTDIEEVRRLIEEAPLEIDSYEALIRWAQKECRFLALVREDLIDQLGTTFVPAVAFRGRELLSALNSIVEARQIGDTERFNQLCSDWFRSSRFSDSSTQEKDRMANRMRFKHPCSGEYVYCFWHGKVRTGVYRLHFEWPPPFAGKDRRLFVAYFGPKLTKQ